MTKHDLAWSKVFQILKQDREAVVSIMDGSTIHLIHGDRYDKHTSLIQTPNRAEAEIETGKAVFYWYLPNTTD